MGSIIKRSAFIILILFLAACSNPRDRFIEAAMGSKEAKGKDREAIECAADRLQTKLTPEQFEELTDDLIRINNNEISPFEANLKLMGTYGMAIVTCSI